MDQQPHLRASDRDRQQVADRLSAALSEGRLTLDEFDERLSATYAAKTYGDLAEVTADLPPPKGASLATANQIAAAEKQADSGRTAVRHGWAPWRPWLAVALIVAVIVAAAGFHFWPMWIIIPWGLMIFGRVGGGHRRGGC